MSVVELLQDLLRTNTINPPGNEEPAAQIIGERLSAAGLNTSLMRSPQGRVNLVARLEGPTDCPALVLLSHTDVVGVEEENWSHDPFGGEVIDGFVWGRGALDMKDVAAMHTEAVVTLAGSGMTPMREVIVLAVADEEDGGGQGAHWLLSEHPEALGFAAGRPTPEVLGEGAYGISGLVDAPLIRIAVGEKSAVRVRLRAEGRSGHGSLPPRRQAPLDLAHTIARIATHGTPHLHPVMREHLKILSSATRGSRAAMLKALSSAVGPVLARAQVGRLRPSGILGVLLSDTVSTTMLSAGYRHNVIPGEATAELDCRLLPDTDPDDFLKGLRRVAARRNVTVSADPPPRSSVSVKGPLYGVIRDVSQTLLPGCVVAPTLCQGMTDVRFFRAAGATGYGWVPLVLTPELLSTFHGHDERVPVGAFERAVEVMTEVIRRAAT